MAVNHRQHRRGVASLARIGVALLLIIGLWAGTDALGFDLPTLERMALERSPLVRRGEAEIMEVEARMESLRRDFGLHLNYHGRSFPTGGPGGDESPGGYVHRGDLEIAWELARDGFLERRKELASLEKIKESLRAKLNGVSAAELFDLRVSYVQALKEQRRIRSERELEELQGQVMQRLDSLLEKGEVIPLDLALARHDARSREKRIQSHQRRYEHFLETIKRATGLSGNVSLEDVEGVPDRLSHDEAKATHSHAGSLEHLRLRREALQAESAVAPYLRFSIYGGYAFQEDRKGVLSDGPLVGIRLSVPLNVLEKIRSREAELHHRGRQLSLEEQRLQDEIASEAERAYGDFLERADQLEVTEEWAAILEEQIRQTELLLERPLPDSTVSPLDLLRKKAQLAETLTQVALARYDLWIAHFRLQRIAMQ